MSEPLIAIFVLPDNATRGAYLDALGLNAFGRNVDSWLAYVDGSDGLSASVVTGGPADAVDLLFIHDARLNDFRRDGLGSIFERCGSVAIVRHTGSVHHENHEDHLAQILPERAAPDIFENHDAGPVFEYLRGIGEAFRNGNIEAYHEVLERLRLHVCGDRVLEAKLDLLHRCLTPEGAGKLPDSQEITDLLDINLTPPVQIDLESPVQNGEASKKASTNLRTVGEVVRYLEAHKDCFAKSYVLPLTSIRDALLGED